MFEPPILPHRGATFLPGEKLRVKSGLQTIRQKRSAGKENDMAPYAYMPEETFRRPDFSRFCRIYLFLPMKKHIFNPQKRSRSFGAAHRPCGNPLFDMLPLCPVRGLFHIRPFGGRHHVFQKNIRSGCRDPEYAPGACTAAAGIPKKFDVRTFLSIITITA